MDDVGRLYRGRGDAAGTHLALKWNGVVRYVVPRETAAQRTCWSVFRPGLLGFPMRAIARMPRVFACTTCGESEQLEEIRKAVGNERGTSCCRAGAAGPWKKETLLLMGTEKADPQLIVKAGTGGAANALLENEAHWLRRLGSEARLAKQVPELVTHRSGEALSFIAQRPAPGRRDFTLGGLQMGFLRELQRCSLRRMGYRDSIFSKTLRSRAMDLEGLLSEAWSRRMARTMEIIERSLERAPVLLVAAHSDFTPWNIRRNGNALCVFDWEYAAEEQLPLFDCLHFVLLPMALRRRPPTRMAQKMDETLALCWNVLGSEPCYQAKAQTLAYLLNICTLYFWSVRGNAGTNPVIESYARLIDYLCRR